MKNLLRLSISILFILALFTMNNCKKNVEEPKITLGNVSVTLLIGESFTLTYTITPSTIKDVEWTSDNQTVASVQNGEIKALTAGSANITVKVKNSTASAICQVTVNSLSKKILLTSHIWKFNDLSSTNWLAQLYINSLNMTNTTVNFDAAGTYTGSMTGQTENGSWEFNADETSIIIDKGTAYEIKADIVQLTSNVLELNAIYHDATLGNFPVTIKLVK
jgi:Bacterial Ig-like domain (group 2)